MSYNSITVTGTYTDPSGNPVSSPAGSAFVRFYPSSVVTQSGQVIIGNPSVAFLDSSGHFSVSLACTDPGAGFNPTSFYYTVDESEVWPYGKGYSGVSPRGEYQISLPHSLGSTVDLSDLTPIVPSGTAVPYVLQSSVGAPNGVASLDSSGIVPLSELPALSGATGSYYVAPTGNASLDTAAINSALSTYLRVVLSGDYYLNGSITLPTGAVLDGLHGSRGTTSRPTALHLAAGFAGAQVFTYPAGSSEQEIRNLTVDATTAGLAAGTCHGVNAQGSITYGKLYDLLFIGPGLANAIRLNNTGGTPFGWTGRRISVRNTNGTGINLVGATDGNWEQVQSTNCGTDAWIVNGCQNSRFIACQGDRAQAGRGLHVTGAGWGTGAGSGGAIFSGFTTDRNQQSGCFVDSTGTAPLIFAGCSFRRDGADNNGTRAGMLVSGATNPVIVAGGGVFPGTEDDGTGPDTPVNGLSYTNASCLIVDDAYIQGVTTAVHDGGGSTHVHIGPGVAQATGPTSAPVVSFVSHAATLSSQPTAPAAVTSTSLVMAGLGTSATGTPWVLTPKLTGLVVITITAQLTVSTALATATYGARYGTGAAPANAVAVTGTRFGAAGDPTTQPPVAGVHVSVSLTDQLQLTPGTAYWFDLALATSNAADSVSVNNVSVQAFELR